MRLAAPLALALLVVLLVFAAPVSNSGSDAALQLVAAQALVDQGSLDLGVYRHDRRLSYDLERDYRVVRAGPSRRYYLWLPPILDAPFVWLARRAGLDMLRPADERALQNLLSALVCGLLPLLLYALYVRLAAPRAALAIVAVVTLGSPLVSTLGTALWGAGPALLLTLAALLSVVRPGRQVSPGRLVLAALLLALAYLCRPASAFAALGLLAAGLTALQARARWRALGALALLLAGGLAAAAWLGWSRLGTLVPIYYSPLKAWPNTPLGLGLSGTLLSPGRGLLVFCPFVLPIAVGVGVCGRRFWREPLAWLGLVWIGTQSLLTSVKPYWWGGNSYGPRLLLETLPAWGLLACLAWRDDVSTLRRSLAGTFAVLGLIAIAIHSGQGLWNPAVLAWNRGPAARLDVAMLFDWRFPQFLATERGVAARDLAWQLSRLEELEPGQALGADSRRVAYVDFHPLEGSWRPSAPSSALHFRPRGFDASETYLLELRASTSVRQRWRLRLGDWRAEAVFVPPGPFAVRLPLPGALLAEAGERELRLVAPDATQPTPGDSRRIGPRLHALRFLHWPSWSGELRADQDAFFAAGFADAEPGGRWTVSERAEIHLPTLGAPGQRARLLLRARGNGLQRVEVLLEDRSLGTLRYDSSYSTQALELEPAAGRASPARLTLLFPDAHALPPDARQLGVSVLTLQVQPAEPAGGI